MQQMAQALGRVFGPVVLSALLLGHKRKNIQYILYICKMFTYFTIFHNVHLRFSRDPRWPYACAAAAAMIGASVLMSLGHSFRKRVIDAWPGGVLAASRLQAACKLAGSQGDPFHADSDSFTRALGHGGLYGRRRG